MKKHNTLKELLEAYEKFQDFDHYMAYKKVIDDEIDDFVASNSLALGKPKPLAKNKQTQEFFCQWYEDKQTECDGMKYQCNECSKIEKRADATSR